MAARLTFWAVSGRPCCRAMSGWHFKTKGWINRFNDEDDGDEEVEEECRIINIDTTLVPPRRWDNDIHIVYFFYFPLINICFLPGHKEMKRERLFTVHCSHHLHVREVLNFVSTFNIVSTPKICN